MEGKEIKDLKTQISRAKKDWWILLLTFVLVMITIIAFGTYLHYKIISALPLVSYSVDGKECGSLISFNCKIIDDNQINRICPC